MKPGSFLKKLFCSVVLTLFASLCFLPPVSADYTDSADHHVQCRDNWSNDKDKCNRILGKAMQKESGSKEEQNLLNLAIKCHSKADTDLDRCRDPKIVRTFVTDKKWRTEHKKELADLAKTFEAADDKCTKASKAGVEKCIESKKSDKKKKKCVASVEKKAKKCLKKAEKSFLKALKKLKPPK